MHKPVSKAEVKQYVGKEIIAYKKDGGFVTGKLVRISGDRLVLASEKGKKVKTKAILPLVLFDLLAIGTAPFAFGGYGPGYGGYPGPGPGYGPGFGGGYGFGGYPGGGFFW